MTKLSRGCEIKFCHSRVKRERLQKCVRHFSKYFLSPICFGDLSLKCFRKFHFVFLSPCKKWTKFGYMSFFSPRQLGKNKARTLNCGASDFIQISDCFSITPAQKCVLLLQACRPKKISPIKAASLVFAAHIFPKILEKVRRFLFCGCLSLCFSGPSMFCDE